MKFVLLIAGDTILSVRRHRVVLAFLLLSLAGMALVTTGITNATRSVARTQEAKAHGVGTNPADAANAADTQAQVRQMVVTFNAFFAGCMSLAGSLLSLVMFCTVVASEIHTGTIRVTLAKPVPRSAYLVGKWLGATAVLATYCLVAGVAGGILGMTYHVQGVGLLASVPWLSFCGSLVLGAVGLVYSLFVRPPIAGVLAWFTSATWFGWLLPLYAVLPSYEMFDVWGATMLGTPVGVGHLVMMTLYAADVVAVLLLLALVRFRRMEIV